MSTTNAIINATVPELRKGRYRVKSPTRGGARPGAGRPKGSTALLTARTLVEAIEQESGRPFEQMLAQGYVEAVDRQDVRTRLEYERMILGKVVSDRTAVEVTDTTDTVAAKTAAFRAALEELTKAGERK